jgi:hypothetical protein
MGIRLASSFTGSKDKKPGPGQYSQEKLKDGNLSYSMA